MTLGVFVEGPSDRQIIPILIRKLGYRAAIHTRVVRQGDMLNSSRMSQHVEGLLRMRGQLHEILVFMDSEGVDPEETLHRTKPVSVELNRVAGRIPVRFIIVDHSFEGWLACDFEALRAVVGRNADVHIRGNLEDHSRPADLVDRVFGANGKDFVKTAHNPKIAEHVIPENILEKSPTFRHIASALSGRVT